MWLALTVALTISCGSDHSGSQSAATGTLALTVASLPAGSQGSIDVFSTMGFQQDVTASGNLDDLTPGAYTITAASVTVGDTAYSAQPTSQVATVLAGATATANVTYAPNAPTNFVNLVPGFQARAITFMGATHSYQIYVPVGYTPSHSWPVVLFAAGSDQSGNNNTSQLSVGLGPHIQANPSGFAAIAVFPQEATGQANLQFDSMMVVMLDATMREANIDPARQYLTGVSVGGFRMWAVAYQHPNRFAALAPMSAGLTPSEFGVSTEGAAIAVAAQVLRTEPIHQYNGDNDGTVPIATYGYPLRDAFIAANAPNYTFIVVPGGTHQSTWDTAYADPQFWTWLFAQHR